MTVDAALVDRIVSGVLAQLQPTAAAPSTAPQPALHNPTPSPSSPAAKTEPPSPAPTASLVVPFTASVITANLLESQAKQATAVQFTRKAIVTPAAWDWLRNRRVTWTREGQATTAAISTSAASVTLAPAAQTIGRWQLVIQTVTNNVRTLMEEIKRQTDRWSQELVGDGREVIATVGRLIGTAERQGVLAISRQAELVAMEANRHERVRAVVVRDARHLAEIRQFVEPNVIVINPSVLSFIDLRNVARECAPPK